MKRELQQHRYVGRLIRLLCTDAVIVPSTQVYGTLKKYLFFSFYF